METILFSFHVKLGECCSRSLTSSCSDFGKVLDSLGGRTAMMSSVLLLLSARELGQVRSFLDALLLVFHGCLDDEG